MHVRDIMTAGVECCRPGESVVQAADKMRKLNVGSLPICGEDNKLAGIITDRDITIRCTAEGRDPCTTMVQEAMTPGIVTCFDDDDIEHAVELMEHKQIRRLAVLNHDYQLVGIFSLGDLAVRAANDRLSGEVLEQVSEPALTEH